MRTEIAIIGAGVVGAAIAAELCRRGRKVAVFEQGSPGGAVSGASLACIGTHMMDEEEMPLLIWSCRAWAGLAERSDSYEYRRCGQIRFVGDERDLAAARRWVEMERSFGLRPEVIEPAQVRAIEPLLQGPLLAATWSPDDAVVNPFLAVRTLLRTAQDHGAVLHAEMPVLRLYAEAGRIVGFETAAGRIEADIIVLASGPWTPRLAATLGVALPIVPRKAQCLATVAQPPSIRTVVGACKPDGGVDAGYTQIQQAASGQILFNTVLGGGIADGGDPDFVPEVDRLFVWQSVDTLLRLFPALADVALLRSWVRYEAVTPDDRFLAGRTSVDGLYIAAGDGGTGFIRAPALGRMLADLIADTIPPFRADLYDPMRFDERGAA